MLWLTCKNLECLCQKEVGTGLQNHLPIWRKEYRTKRYFRIVRSISGTLRLMPCSLVETTRSQIERTGISVLEAVHNAPHDRNTAFLNTGHKDCTLRSRFPAYGETYVPAVYQAKDNL